MNILHFHQKIFSRNLLIVRDFYQIFLYKMRLCIRFLKYRDLKCKLDMQQ